MKCVTMYTETFVGFYFEIERNVILCVAGGLLRLLRAFTTNDKASRRLSIRCGTGSQAVVRGTSLPQRAPKIHITLAANENPIYE